MMFAPNRRAGFSLVEVTVVSMLMAVLAMLLSAAWVGVGRTAAGLIGRSQLVQERDLAVAALSRDLGGCSVESNARLGEKIDGRWLKWEYGAPPSNQELKLYYDGGTDLNGSPRPNTVVHYLVESGLLKRRKSVNGAAPTDFTVAKNVHSMSVTQPEGDNRGVEIVLCFSYRTLTLTCDLTAKQPSVSSDQPLSWSIDHYTNP